MTKSDLEAKLAKSVDFLKSELGNVRTGRATPTLIESIHVPAYGATMAVRELGSINLLDNQTLVVSPWDKSLLGPIAKAIRESELHVNPIEDSDRIRVPFPPLTEERRKDLVKVVSTKVEECRQSLRSIRQESMKDIDKDFTDKKIGEDEKFSKKEEVEKILKTHMEEVDTLFEFKKEDLLKI